MSRTETFLLGQTRFLWEGRDATHSPDQWFEDHSSLSYYMRCRCGQMLRIDYREAQSAALQGLAETERVIGRIWREHIREWDERLKSWSPYTKETSNYA